MGRIKIELLQASLLRPFLGVDDDSNDPENSPQYAHGYLYSPSHTDEELEAIRADYLNNIDENFLEPQRKTALDKLSKDGADFIESRYPSFRQQMLQALFTEALFSGLVNRANYIKQVLNWVKSVVAITAVGENQLNAADSIEEIRDVEIDFSPFEETDPNVTINEALQIED